MYTTGNTHGNSTENLEVRDENLHNWIEWNKRWSRQGYNMTNNYLKIGCGWIGLKLAIRSHTEAGLYMAVQMGSRTGGHHCVSGPGAGPEMFPSNGLSNAPRTDLFSIWSQSPSSSEATIHDTLPTGEPMIVIHIIHTLHYSILVFIVLSSITIMASYGLCNGKCYLFAFLLRGNIFILNIDEILGILWAYFC